MPFKPGQSGNPDGRPKGVRSRSAVVREYLEPKKPELIRNAIQMALNGDSSMSQFLMKHFLPALPKDNVLDIQVKLEGSLIEQADYITNLLEEKEISPIECQILLTSIEKKASIKEKVEMKKEIDELKCELKEVKNLLINQVK